MSKAAAYVVEQGIVSADIDSAKRYERMTKTYEIVPISSSFGCSGHYSEPQHDYRPSKKRKVVDDFPENPWFDVDERKLDLRGPNHRMLAEGHAVKHEAIPSVWTQASMAPPSQVPRPVMYQGMPPPAHRDSGLSQTAQMQSQLFHQQSASHGRGMVQPQHMFATAFHPSIKAEQEPFAPPPSINFNGRADGRSFSMFNDFVPQAQIDPALLVNHPQIAAGHGSPRVDGFVKSEVIELEPGQKVASEATKIDDSVEGAATSAEIVNHAGTGRSSGLIIVDDVQISTPKMEAQPNT